MKILILSAHSGKQGTPRTEKFYFKTPASSKVYKVRKNPTLVDFAGTKMKCKKHPYGFEGTFL